MKKIAILGSTGSIGRNALEVIRDLDNYDVFALYGGNNISLLVTQKNRVCFVVLVQRRYYSDIISF